VRLGYHVSAATVQRILRARRRGPARPRMVVHKRAEQEAPDNGTSVVRDSLGPIGARSFCLKVSWSTCYHDVSFLCRRGCYDGLPGSAAGCACCLARCTAPMNTRIPRPRTSRSRSIWAITTSLADWLTGVMSPKPTVLNVVTVK